MTAPTPAPPESVEGASPRGHIHATYAALVAAFGEPHDDGDGYKTDVRWCLRFGDGTLAVVCNFKNGPCFLGPDAPGVETITDWRVEGYVSGAVRCVEQALGVVKPGDVVEPGEKPLPRFRDYLEARGPTPWDGPDKTALRTVHEALRAGYGSAAACGAPDLQGHALEFARLVLGVGGE